MWLSWSTSKSACLLSGPKSLRCSSTRKKSSRLYSYAMALTSLKLSSSLFWMLSLNMQRLMASFWKANSWRTRPVNWREEVGSITFSLKSIILLLTILIPSTHWQMMILRLLSGMPRPLGLTYSYPKWPSKSSLSSRLTGWSLPLYNVSNWSSRSSEKSWLISKCKSWQGSRTSEKR